MTRPDQTRDQTPETRPDKDKDRQGQGQTRIDKDRPGQRREESNLADLILELAFLFPGVLSGYSCMCVRVVTVIGVFLKVANSCAVVRYMTPSPLPSC